MLAHPFQEFARAHIMMLTLDLQGLYAPHSAGTISSSHYFYSVDGGGMYKQLDKFVTVNRHARRKFRDVS
jgi:hypothetical protein